MGDIMRFLSPNLIKVNMQAESRDEAVRELAELLFQERVLKDKERYIQDVFWSGRPRFPQIWKMGWLYPTVSRKRC